MVRTPPSRGDDQRFVCPSGQEPSVLALSLSTGTAKLSNASDNGPNAINEGTSDR
jgi:hypothetical protein